ncbi:MAG: MBL fold metallo-hydrolase [Gemmatimonadaceae bacterium]
MTGLCLAPIAVGNGQPGLDTVRIRSVKVTEGIYMLLGAGGNIGVSAGADGAFLIDDQYAPLTDKIRAAVAGITNRPIRFVLNTHWHGDHTGGNERMGQVGALIVAHENVRKRMSVAQFNKFFNSTTPPSPKAALPVVTFTQAVTFHLNNDEIHAFHTEPAHTDGDAIIHFRRGNVVHMGDIYFNGMYPFIDVASGGSIDGVIAATDRAIALSDDSTKVIPGHGPLSNRSGLRAYRAMLSTIRERVKREIAARKDLSAVLAAKPTAEFDAVWGKGFLPPQRFIEIVYADLSRP